MPCINLKTNIKIENSDLLKKELGKAITCFPGKSKQWLMIELHDEVDIKFQGNDEPCVMVETTILGEPSKEAAEAFVNEVMNIIEKELGIPSNRVYVSIFPTKLWGFDHFMF